MTPENLQIVRECVASINSSQKKELQIKLKFISEEGFELFKRELDRAHTKKKLNLQTFPNSNTHYLIFDRRMIKKLELSIPSIEDTQHEILAWILIQFEKPPANSLITLYIPSFLEEKPMTMTLNQLEKRIRHLEKKVNTILVLKDMEETLHCPDYLIIDKEIQTEDVQEFPSRKDSQADAATLRSKGTAKRGGRFAAFGKTSIGQSFVSSSSASDQPAPNQQQPNPISTVKRENERYRLKLRGKYTFPVFERFKKNDALNSVMKVPEFANFKIANRENMCIQYLDQDLFAIFAFSEHEEAPSSVMDDSEQSNAGY